MKKTYEDGQLHLQLQRSINHLGYTAYCYTQGFEINGRRIGPTKMAQIELVELTAGQWNEPTAILDEYELQQWMNELWAVGIRPTADLILPQKDANMAAHLADMRAIAFDRLKIQPPK